MDNIFHFNYTSGKNARFELHDENNNRSFFLQLTHVNTSIAALQFFSDQSYNELIDPPSGFIFHSDNTTIQAYQKSLFITWVGNYILFYDFGGYDSEPVLTIGNERIQTIECVDAIVTCI
jgi:hypothetical protein